ncbi:TPA: hypothetical protein HA235_00485 [Candidatus Woesearchaeota archaeon]|nr:hypothetical protein [Candidatus Woesearchaeota archaeon]HIH31161.1 hypothetical protein [Candidatus Woesearchaeota archaeon]HIH54642.1 hypothetical protein [Candidatus Woesearchaeota archaeon]HIJ02305.1 hypothetical protein [Candidatus Woesearchaeota archaeon]HIJ14218.1 hypothetical protein [Candidatus Woesearchaeota archaeon]
MPKFAILCGSGTYNNFLTEVNTFQARNQDDAFEKGEDYCNNLEASFIFPLNKANIDKLKTLINR